MFTDAKGQIRVRASFAGEVEICVRAGERIHAGHRLAVIEGERQMETVRARAPALVTKLCVADGAEVEDAALLMVLQELQPNWEAEV